MKLRVYSQEEIKRFFPQTRKEFNHRHKVYWLREQKGWIKWWEYLRKQGNLLIHEFEELEMPSTNSLSDEKIRYYMNNYKATHYLYELYEINGYYAGIIFAAKYEEDKKYKEYKLIEPFQKTLSVKYDNSWWF